MREIKHISVNGVHIAYMVLGDKKIDIVIEMGLGSTIGEWWQFAKKLSKDHTVLLYERAGYGMSEIYNKERTAKNIADELYGLLEQLEHEEKVTLVAHSQGGLYAQQFARLYPHLVKALVLIDPLSANDDAFKTLLTEVEYKRSGVDKSRSFKLGYILSKLHLGYVIKKVMKSAPRFYYYHDFSEEETNYILNALTKPKFYQTAMEEYRLAHSEKYILPLRDKKDFPDLPIYLVTHTSERAIKETMEFGGMDEEGAKKVEDIWQNLMKAYLTFTSKSSFVQAKKSSHYIHLTEPELIYHLIEKAFEEK